MLLEDKLVSTHVVKQRFVILLDWESIALPLFVVVQSSSLAEILVRISQVVLHLLVDEAHLVFVDLSRLKLLSHSSVVETKHESILIAKLVLVCGDLCVFKLVIFRHTVKVDGALEVFEAVKVILSGVQIAKLQILNDPVLLYNVSSVESLKSLFTQIEGKEFELGLIDQFDQNKLVVAMRHFECPKLGLAIDLLLLKEPDVVFLVIADDVLHVQIRIFNDDQV